MNNKFEITFNAIPSGDYEGFCFDVDKETFNMINKKMGWDNSPSSCDESYFYKDKYTVYPGEIFRCEDFQVKNSETETNPYYSSDECEYKVTITLERIRKIEKSEFLED